MNFFMSNVHGDADAYKEMKRRMEIRKNDTLYLLGDVLDGNNGDPGACIEILDDVMQNDNVILLLGDHEYFHVMYYIARKSNSEEDIKYFYDKLCHLDYTGKPLLRYFMNNMSTREYSKYMTYLTECSMSEFLKIGDFSFYLVHSSPCKCKEPELWQEDIIRIPMDLNKDYAQDIDSDPDMKSFLKKDPTLRVGRAITIAGGEPVKTYFEKDEKLLESIPKDSIGLKKQKIIVKGNKALINCGWSASGKKVCDGWESDLACLYADAAGFNVSYLSDDFNK